MGHLELQFFFSSILMNVLQCSVRTAVGGHHGRLLHLCLLGFVVVVYVVVVVFLRQSLTSSS